MNPPPPPSRLTSIQTPFRYIHQGTAHRFGTWFPPKSIRLLAFDPPYYKIVDEEWDNQWKSVGEYVQWFIDFLRAYRPALTDDASVIFFGGLGSHGCRPFQKVMEAIEEPAARLNLTYRNQIAWKKRRAYGKSHDYLFCREEIVWYSASPERTSVVFNVPYLNEKRGYEGWNKEYPAHSEFKRVSNVWADIPELMRPPRKCAKPVELMGRIIDTHSMPGDLVVDPFAGWGTTGIAALGYRGENLPRAAPRRFEGFEAIAVDADSANARCVNVANGRAPE